MAMMFSGAMDWSFDMFVDAMNSVQALPMQHGVRPSRNLTDVQRFAVYVKTAIKFADFDAYYSVDDAILCTLEDMLFSDWYKDMFNQRPHFDWALVGALCGVYGSTYSIMVWDRRDPVAYYSARAKETREALEKWAREEAM